MALHCHHLRLYPFPALLDLVHSFPKTHDFLKAAKNPKANRQQRKWENSAKDMLGLLEIVS